MIFLTPLALIGLVALPVIYWLVKATPPPPKEQAYPSLQILRRLRAGRADTARSPLWLLVLRLLAVALLVLGLSQPVWLGRDLSAQPSQDLVLVLDNGWAAVPHWQERLRAARSLAERRFRAGHEVTLLLSAPDADGSMAAPFTTRDRARFEERLLALTPHSWPSDRAQSARQVDALRDNTSQGTVRDIVLLSDGVSTPADPSLARALHASGSRVSDMRWPGCDTMLLSAHQGDNGALTASFSALPCPTRPLAVRARDENGGTLGIFPLTGKDASGTDLPLPPLLRDRATRLALESDTLPLPGPSALYLLDAGQRRHPVGLLTPGTQDTPLTGQGFFLAQAIEGVGELHRGAVPDLLKQKLSVLIATDGTLADDDTHRRVADWVRHGGVLIRFAGPVLASDPNASSPDKAKTLLPVPLMGGMRQLGGPMSWGKPQVLSAFAEHSPFDGLALPKEVTVTRQVLAQPTAELGDHVWARLSDGTPLVTASAFGQGELVLFHVTGTADWSSLPLSGLFPAMLERLVQRSVGQKDQSELRQLVPFTMLDAHGQLVAPPEAARPLSVEAFATTRPDVQHPPGFYGPRLSRRAFNLGDHLPPITPEALMGTALTPDHVSPDHALAPYLLGAALLLLLADFLVALWLRGMLGRLAMLGLLVAAPALMAPHCALAQEDDEAPKTQAVTHGTVPGAALETRLGYVLTGHDDIDEASREGLQGLSNYASDRSSAVMGHPDGVTPGKDDLAYYPMLYWPITEDVQEDPKRSAALNSFMAHGGILMLDTQGVGSELSTQDEGQTRSALKRATAGLVVPPLSKLDDHHVLAHSFYLLHDFPGRVQGLPVWVARSGDDSNDDVSPIIIGAGDWAHAWAMDAQGNTPYAVIPGGDDQRTQAYRFGVNLLLYALTGNYKADQMRVPELLKRMEQ
ncbi:DUF4159 domain-containing protein [Asaia siamensis]|uniref:RNA-binding protein n=1 Tax=Asaia siamensis TaxID=110479 RepID=A0ABQ1LSL5_9PROT|nr:DUF4159 domain-containing protein [Asaia siamensis]GBR03346.1 hypothetical protein AA0323_0278 [Asaia siamensis NRIC 0323]GGC29378.1 RNA-binding protein [Asaia siamensis]